MSLRGVPPGAPRGRRILRMLSCLACVARFIVLIARTICGVMPTVASRALVFVFGFAAWFTRKWQAEHRTPFRYTAISVAHVECKDTLRAKARNSLSRLLPTDSPRLSKKPQNSFAQAIPYLSWATSRLWFWS